MKKSYFFIGVCLFLLSSISCSSNDDSPSIDTEQLVGTWLLESAKIDGEEVGSSDKVRFTSSGRAYYTYYDFGAGGEDIIEDADYSLSGNSINVTWDDSDAGNETDTFQILELTSIKLKLKSTQEGETLIEVYNKQ